MLGLTQIELYYPENEKPFGKNILREYLQYKILEIVFGLPIAGKLSFLGGTALRIIHGNSRFSEDLDFDNFGLTPDDFVSLAKGVKIGIEREGYEIEIRNVFKGAYRCYIKIPDILFDNKITDLRGEKMTIQIDTAPHDFNYAPDKKIINKFDVFTQILATPPDILFSQKIYAALNRKRAKGRDFFDIVFISQKTKPNYDYLKAKLKIANEAELKNKLFLAVKELDFNILAKDVGPFLINSGENKRVLLFKQYLEQFEF